MTPWISTVQRDKAKFCYGASSDGSWVSFSSGSQHSFGVSSPSFSASSENSQISQSTLTPPQKLLVASVVALFCCCICILGGLAVAFKRKKGKKNYSQDDTYYGEEQYPDQAYGQYPEYAAEQGFNE
jgi:hypothetical protein